MGAACDEIGFPFENAFCTRLSMDMYEVEEWEVQTLCNLAQEIVRMPLISVPDGARNVRDLSPDDRMLVRRMEEIFWTEMTDLTSYQFISQVNPVGGDEKATSVVEICKRLSVPLEDCMYVGDGVTDARALQVVRRSGGLALAFNGNIHALREAEVGRRCRQHHNHLHAGRDLQSFRAGRGPGGLGGLELRFPAPLRPGARLSAS